LFIRETDSPATSELTYFSFSNLTISSGEIYRNLMVAEVEVRALNSENLTIVSGEIS